MSINLSNSRLWYFARSILLCGIGSALLASCSNLGYSSDASSPEQDASVSNPEALAAEFSFPQSSCGEQATQPSGTWYVVYIDGANPDEIRRKYCKDAIGTVRDKTGTPTVQVASLTDYSKALKLATAVGGEVETTVGQSSPSPASPSASPGSPTPADASSGTGYLTAVDPGASINIRESASTSAPIELTGRSGDPIRIAEQRQGDDGRTWYKVSLQSGQGGWVRSDFITRESANNPASNSGSASTGSSFNAGTVASTSGGVTTPSSQTSASPIPSSSGSYSSPNSTSPAATSSAATSDRTASPYSTSLPVSDQSDSNQSDPSDQSDQSDSSDRSDQYAADTAADPEDSSEATSATSGESTTLVSDNPASRINIRDDASTTSPIQHIGYGGDPVQIIDSTQGEDGYTWYQVEFESGAVGWVRGDLVGGG